MSEDSLIGKRLPRVDAPEKTTGEALYTVDISFPKMLHGKILRSIHPHARILNIDISKAMRLPGVKAVITGKDTWGIRYGFTSVIPQTMDELGLAIDKVRYIGDEVAAVAAVDEETAAEALELIEVDYEVLPAVFDPEAAMQPGAPLIHDDKPNNIGSTTLLGFGDVEKAFRESAYVREDRFSTAAQNHCCLEPHNSLASVDASGRLTLWTSTQFPFMVRHLLARTLKMPESEIRVIKPHIGGGFGGKTEMFSHDFASALLAIKTGRPVRVEYSREEVAIGTYRRHPMTIDLKTGVKKDGTLMAIQCKTLMEGGAYTVNSQVTTYLNGVLIPLPYKLPNMKYECHCVYTNKPIFSAQRGHGIMHSRFAIDLQLDMIAQELGMDPMDLRLKNAIETGEITGNKLEVKSCGFKESVKKAAVAAGWREKRGKLPGNRGIGMGTGAFMSGAGWHIYDTSTPFSAGLLRLNEDGTTHLMTGAADLGQGSSSLVSQIVAEELGIDQGDVRITTADTELTPPDWGTGSSRGTVFFGNAIKNTVLDAKRQLFEAIAQHLEANAADLEAKNHRIYIKGTPERGMSFAEAVKVAHMIRGREPITGRGHYHPIYTPNLATGEGNTTPSFSFACEVAEVEVDVETGRITLLNMTACHDSGTIINPMSMEGQVEGSISTGQGFALSEDIFHHDKGQVFNPSFLDYAIPTAADTPHFGIHTVETNDPEGPYGAKEAGEGAIVPIAPAIASAIYDAIGVWMTSLPITPEKVLKALSAKEKNHQGV